jgi:two-component system, chemotaxis family, protein-glutamate methylesterase/glutaminase
MTIRVLIVDDSATMRALLQARLEDEDDIRVVGTACNALEARELIKLVHPDVLTLDIEMPGMDGLTFLEKIMSLRPMPVIIVSGSTQEGTVNAARALALGALSCYSKADRSGRLLLDDSGALAQLVREAAQVKFGPSWPVSPQVETQVRQTVHTDASLIAIGSSTGGVEALRILLRDFGPDCPPTLIVQHVNARFAPAIAESLDQATRAKVVLAESDIRLERGTIYLAPGGDRHLLLGRAGNGGYRTVLRPGGLVTGHRPSVDALFHSIAALEVPGAVGVLLTGMGKDGAEGLLKMQRNGALTIAQDEASCVVFGMPRAAISLGAAEIVAPLGRIASHVLRRKAA